MTYSPTHAARSTLIYGYGTTTTTVNSPQSGQPFQPINNIVKAGKKDTNGNGLTLTPATLQGRGYSNALTPKYDTILHLDIVIDMNRSGNVNWNDYATYYSLTSLYDYRLDLSQFEVTSTFYEGGNKSLLSVVDSTTFINLKGGEQMGYLFRSAAGISNDMVVPYSRLYGWSGVIA